MKTKLISITILISLIFSFGCNTENMEKETKQDSSLVNISYFGQKPPGDTAIVFAPGNITTNHHEHSRIQFSKNGTEMFWAVIPIDTSLISKGESPYKSKEQNIWHSKIINNQWTKPSILDLTKTIGGSSPTFSGTGNIFYYRTPKQDVDPKIRPKPSQLWKVSYTNGQWGESVHENDLIPIQERKTYMSFCFAKNGNLYFDYGGPDKDGEWQWYIYKSELKNGKYMSPVKMSNGINEFDMSWCPWIAPDESYIIYSSSRDGEFGNGDLYINFKNEDGNWSSPINMGAKVNNESQERFPSVSPDGKYLFFARHMTETFSDIYWVSAKIIEELKSKHIK